MSTNDAGSDVNHVEMNTGRSEANRVRIFDTTLRDGEQSPGISLNKQEKLEIAHQLARLGVDVIEAGFPITSPGDFESVQAIAREVEGPVICALARTSKQDIEAAWNAVKDSERPRIHTFLATSDMHIEYKLQTTREDVKGQVRAAVAQARELHRGRRVLARGRLALGHRVHGRGDPDRARRGRHHDQRARHRRLHDAAGVRRDVHGALPAGARPARRRSSRCTATTTSAWPSPTRWPAWKRAAARSSARSTGSASAPATRRSRRS